MLNKDDSFTENVKFLITDKDKKEVRGIVLADGENIYTQFFTVNFPTTITNKRTGQTRMCFAKSEPGEDVARSIAIKNAVVKKWLR